MPTVYMISGTVKEDDDVTPIEDEVIIALYPNPVAIVGVAQSDASGHYTMTLFGPGDLPLIVIDTGRTSYTDDGGGLIAFDSPPTRDARVIGYTMAIETIIEI